jgi:hypothetical protein
VSDTGAVTGQVTDATGAPVAGATIAVGAGGQHPDIAALTNAEGSFRLGGLAPGPVTLGVHSGGRPAQSVGVIVREGEETQVDIRLDDPPAEPADDAGGGSVVVDASGIDWGRVQLVRVVLATAEDDAPGDFLFGPGGPDHATWSPRGREQGHEYTYTVTYFLAGRLQQSVPPVTARTGRLVLASPG